MPVLTRLLIVGGVLSLFAVTTLTFNAWPATATPPALTLVAHPASPSLTAYGAFDPISSSLFRPAQAKPGADLLKTVSILKTWTPQLNKPTTTQLAPRAITVSSTLTIGREAQGQLLDCGHKYNANALGIIIPGTQYKCDSLVAVEDPVTGIRQSLKVIGHTLTGIPEKARVSALSVAAASGFGVTYKQNSRHDGMVIRALNPGENAQDLSSLPATTRVPTFVGLGNIVVEDTQVHVKNIYFEARGETAPGAWLGVWLSALNRQTIGDWGDTIEDVVYADSQYSWTNNNNAKRGMRERGTLRKIQRAVIRFETANFTAFETGLLVMMGPDMIHYHASNCFPRWAKQMHRVIQLGHHIFYQRRRPSDTRVASR